MIAQMAELVDAPDSKSGIRKDVQVRFLFWALDNQLIIKAALCGFLKFASNLQAHFKTQKIDSIFCKDHRGSERAINVKLLHLKIQSANLIFNSTLINSSL